MKVQLLGVVALCIFTYTEARMIHRDPSLGPSDPFNPDIPRIEWPPKSTGPYLPQMPDTLTLRYRRHADPQGSIVLQGTQPMSGPDRRPSIDLNYNQRFNLNDRTTLDAFGGANVRGGHWTPHAGANIEHRFRNNGFIRGTGQVQPGPHGGMSPSFGVGGGFRF